MSNVVNAVEIKHLRKQFNSPWKRTGILAVNDVNISIAEGEIYGLIGPNGSGKSTTMKALLGLIQPNTGICNIFGAAGNSSEARALVGFLPENAYFYKFLTGKETLHFYGKLSGLNGKELYQRTDELLKLVDLEEAQDRRLGGYSKGMLQRIGLAQALIAKPKLVVLDEPTAGVDPIGSRTIRDIILNLKKSGITVFLCSHLLEQVQEVCDKIGIIYKGKMLIQGSIKELIELPDETEILLKNASPELLTTLRTCLKQFPESQLLHMSPAKATLESLFITTVEEDSSSKKKRST